MAEETETIRVRPLHPLHAMLLAFPLALFTACLVADWAYATSYHIQWINFAAWLNFGGMVFAGFVLLWALIDLFRRRARAPLIYFLVLLAMFVIGFVNALIHGRDAYGSMPAGLILSVIVALLAIAAAWIGYSGRHYGRRQRRSTGDVK